ncbi:MAG: right-handed parallel beta-helix repeat-containing protein [Ignavibacteriae bacterium]|nr:right-handed parallel beta-helix repeat-containing protein [Ignavibacteriota bacterium]
MIKQIFILIFNLLIVILSAQTNEIHVSINGSDLNEGTISSPFKTISRAAQEAMPGDIITVHEGIYREQIIPPRGGNSNQERIIYEAGEGEKVEIRGSEIIKGWKKVNNNIWEVKIPVTFFGKFNPYKDIIHGDWFFPTPEDRIYHTGAVYLNGNWLMEAYKKEEVIETIDEKNLLWYSETNSDTTTIWAQFYNANPNIETVEINVRQTIFYPDKPFINFITVSGFIMQHAATNWAPPTAEQMGLIGTHWSRGWVIENNIIKYSKCVGLSLGKYGDQFDNKDTESAEGYVGTINRALEFGWNKGTIGGHIVKNNIIAYCEQSGIVGSMGCAFSTITGNTIHNIYERRLFSGAEMAGIKFHGAVDVIIENNHIYSVNIGIWLDWMAQGAQINKNLMHNNLTDIFLEVNHGPTLVSNNIMLSPHNLVLNSSGVAVVHNLFSGKIDALYYDSRLTPYLKPHSTYIESFSENQSGDLQFYNNLFVSGSDVSQYSKAILPVIFDGNVFTKGSKRPNADSIEKKYGELNENGKEKLKTIESISAIERNSINATDIDTNLKFIKEGENIFLETNMNQNWVTEQKRTMVTTNILDIAIVPKLRFDNADGSILKIDTDYFGKVRNKILPSPGPFEDIQNGRVKIKVW